MPGEWARLDRGEGDGSGPPELGVPADAPWPDIVGVGQAGVLGH